MVIRTLVTKEVLGWRHPTYRCCNIALNHFYHKFFSQTTTQHHAYFVAILTMQDHAFVQSLVIQGFSKTILSLLV